MTRAERERVLALAHALRTPITALEIGIGVLGEGGLGTLSPGQRDVVAMLGAELARLRRLVEGSLDTHLLGPYAGPHDRVAADLAELTRASVDPIRPQAAARGVTLLTRASRPVRAHVDRMRLSWAISALVGNALRYAPSASRIVVRVAARQGSQYGVVAVSDEGPGMPSSLRAQIEEGGAGHAFTLSLVREILESHGGKVRIRGRAPKGTVVELHVPRDPAATTDQEKGSRA
jgi:signal transduction histidine kinase